MEPTIEMQDTRQEIKKKLREHFDGKIVRKDLTKKIKEGANVPVYVLEFLLGQYCSSDDDAIIESGVQQVKRILADNFVRPDESQKILSQLRKRGSYTVIDMITVQLDMQKNKYFAQFSNLGLQKVPIEDEYPEKYDRLLCGGIWCIIQLDYEFVEEEKKNGYPIQIRNLKPIQMPHIDIDDLKAGRKAFTKEEWMDVLLRSIGMEPIQWNVDSLDWKEITAPEITQRVMKNVVPGSIILFHNAAIHTPEALPGIIEALQKDGYTLCTVSELVYQGEYTIDNNGMQCPKGAEKNTK